MKSATLKSGREFSVLRRHPWIFSGAIAQAANDLAAGDTVRVCAADGKFLAWGAWSGVSQIRIRVWSFVEEERIDEAFFANRLAASLQRRLCAGVACGTATAQRLVNGEADGLPGLVVDQYGAFLVCQFTAAGVERWKEEICGALARLCASCAGIYERSDGEARTHEGLEAIAGVLRGAEPPELLEITEHGCRYLVDVRRGHKTGFYLDQRVNRTLLAPLAAGQTMLNAFAYSGGFGIAAAKAGAARVVNVDLSQTALELAHTNADGNGISPEQMEYLHGDVFQVLRRFRDSRRNFDMIVLDPPKFVEGRGQLMAGCRGYKDINLLAIKLLNPGGLLATFSCSGLVAPELFQKVVADAAIDAGRRVTIIGRLQQAPDHTEDICFPEGRYLKGLLCRVE